MSELVTDKIIGQEISAETTVEVNGTTFQLGPETVNYTPGSVSSTGVEREVISESYVVPAEQASQVLNLPAEADVLIPVNNENFATIKASAGGSYAPEDTGERYSTQVNEDGSLSFYDVRNEELVFTIPHDDLIDGNHFGYNGKDYWIVTEFDSEQTIAVAEDGSIIYTSSTIGNVAAEAINGGGWNGVVGQSESGQPIIQSELGLTIDVGDMPAALGDLVLNKDGDVLGYTVIVTEVGPEGTGEPSIMFVPIELAVHAEVSDGTAGFNANERVVIIPGSEEGTFVGLALPITEVIEEPVYSTENFVETTTETTPFEHTHSQISSPEMLHPLWETRVIPEQNPPEHSTVGRVGIKTPESEFIPAATMRNEDSEVDG